METRASYLLVGTFVLALMLGLAGFVLWMAGTDSSRRFDTYEIAFTGSVTGLQEGAAVNYRGVRVGTVRQISINQDNLEEITVIVDLEAGTPVREDNYAQLQLQGVTGLSFVELSGGSSDSHPLEPPEDGSLPRIPARASAFEQVFESAPELLTGATDAINQIRKLVNDDNIEHLAITLANLATLSTALAEQRAGIEEIVAELAAATDGLADVTTSSEAFIKELGEDTRSLTERAEATLQEAEAAFGSFAGVGSQFQQIARENREGLRDFTSTGLYEFSQLISETRLLIASLSRISKEIERDPAGFLLGGSSSKGFRPGG
ncbi:MAG: MlaD family protein [Geminicoccaceae bacterium]